MCFLSLIIPVYNVEKYLDNCIRSVIVHDPEKVEIEILLVDDGSFDNSGKICDTYEKQYDYIRVIHKQNGGASSARNAGLRKARGQYIMFLDSDDWWNPETDIVGIIKRVKEHKQTEMFLLTSYDYVEGEGYYKRKEQDVLRKLKPIDIRDYYKTLLDNGNLEVSPCTKILKKAFLYQNSLFFREGIVSEDNEWMLRILRVIKKVEVIDAPLFICRLNREGSVTNNIKIKHIIDLLKIVRLSQKYYEKYPHHVLKNYELCYSSYLWFSALGLSTLLGKEEQKLLGKYFHKTSDVCKYSKSSKTKICYSVYKRIGMGLTAKVLGIYIMLKKRRIINRIPVHFISKVSDEAYIVN